MSSFEEKFPKNTRIEQIFRDIPKIAIAARLDREKYDQIMGMLEMLEWQFDNLDMTTQDIRLCLSHMWDEYGLGRV